MENEQKQMSRPPIVVVLGHVDHGKTSLLDYIKKTKIAEKESGGITQHIGAYEVTIPSEKELSFRASQQAGEGLNSVDTLRTKSAQDDFATLKSRKITFIDTPGHQAFSAMRSRGAKVADIAILVVDASEGVKEQTKEAINAVKTAKIPMIVALNKSDKPQCQPEYVMGELKKYGVETEQMGGKIPAIKTSAKNGQGIDELLETILLVAEMEELKTDISGSAEGTIIESSLDSKKGVIATLLVEKGILKEGDLIVVGSISGKIKNMIDFLGKKIFQAFPSQPVQVLGFEKAPKVGEKFKVFSDLEGVKDAIPAEKEHGFKNAGVKNAGQEDEKKKVLKIVLKADFLGSLEAIESVLKALPQQQVGLEIVKVEAGNIGTADIQLAENNKARIIGFRVKLDEAAKGFSEKKKIFPKTFEIIYELIEEVKSMMEKMIVPEKQRVDLGKIKIIALFKKDKKGQIIGGRVLEGEIKKDVSVEIMRDEELVGKGRIKGLEIEKRDVASAVKGKEVGMWFDGTIDILENDILVVFKEEKQQKKLLSH